MKGALAHLHLLACLLLAMPAWLPAAAHAQDLRTIYVVQPAPVPEGQQALAAKDWVLKQPLVPTKLYELGTDAQLPSKTPPLVQGMERPVAGTQLIGISGGEAVVGCVAPNESAKLSQRFLPCFVDKDADGAFEAVFWRASVVPGLPIISGPMPNATTSTRSKSLVGLFGVKEPADLHLLSVVVPYRDVDPATIRTPFFVGIQRRNFFNIYARENFMIVFGRDAEMGELTTPASFRSSEMPKEVSVMGAQFTAIAEKEGKMLVQVSTSIPPQPFSVVVTTTYTPIMIPR
jgi:hypothetical protein